MYKKRRSRRGRDTMRKPGLYFHNVCPGTQTRVLRVGSWHLYPVSGFLVLETSLNPPQHTAQSHFCFRDSPNTLG